MSDYIKPVAAILLPNIGGLAGGFMARRHIPTWYEGLKKPSWTPPNRVFPLTWIACYTSMGVASYLVWRHGDGFGGDAASPLAWYGGQLILKWAWNPLFFGLHSPKWALVDMVCLWGAVVTTIRMFHDVSPTAAHIMLPYLGWVTFASALNYRIWKDNPEAKVD